jgi:hypothetical protein
LFDTERRLWQQWQQGKLGYGGYMMQAFAVEKLQVKIFSNRREMGRAAGQSVAENWFHSYW